MLKDNHFKESMKIFDRLCKEANVFLSEDYKRIRTFIEVSGSFIFYGLDDASYSSFGIDKEVKFFKLQLDLANALMEKKILSTKDALKFLKDTLTRYNVYSYSGEWRHHYTEVSIKSGKRNAALSFIKMYEERYGKLVNKREKKSVLENLPKT